MKAEVLYHLQRKHCLYRSANFCRTAFRWKMNTWKLLLRRQALVLQRLLLCNLIFLSQREQKAENLDWTDFVLFLFYLSFKRIADVKRCQNTIREAFPPLPYAFWQYLIITFQISFRMMANKQKKKEVQPEIWSRRSRQGQCLSLSLCLMFTDFSGSFTHTLALSWEVMDCSVEISPDFGIQ